ncbi:MAG: hypothetical protein ACYSU7_02405 [Planctomycetota bacterium]|jgi:hypothetical protein
MPSQNSHHRSPRRSGSNTRALLVLNAALLVLLAVVTFAPAADAQGRARGRYAMVAGGVPGSLGSVVYIVDTVNRELIALDYEHNTKRLKGVGHRNVAADMADMARRGPGP